MTRGQANHVVDLAFEQPVLTATTVGRRLDITRPAALTALRDLEELGILVSAGTGPRRQIRWRAVEIMRLLTEDNP